jgi:uncharacterized coiled-coil protein SlyX
MDWQSLAAIIGAIFSSQALTIFIQGKFAQGKTNADAASTLVQSMLEWQKTLTDRITTLETAIRDKDSIIDQLQARVAHLEQEVNRQNRAMKKRTKACPK